MHYEIEHRTRVRCISLSVHPNQDVEEDCINPVITKLV